MDQFHPPMTYAITYAAATVFRTTYMIQSATDNNILNF